MEINWINTKEALPESNQEVLTYFYDEPYGVDQFQILTYYKKGDKFSCEDIANNDLLGQVLGKYDRTVEEDGFYIYDSVDGDRNKYRKHADVITHWQPLLSPTRFFPFTK